MSRDNWDDLRYVLAVADEGTISAAARRLGVNHATVLRRVAAFEEAAGVEIFDKTARGYVVADARQRVIEAAREVDRAVQGVTRMIQGARAPVEGEVRVTSTDTFCETVLPSVVASMRQSAPNLKVTLLCTNAHLDMTRLQADVTIRPAATLPEDLYGEAVAVLGFGVYRAAGRPPVDTWLGLHGPLARSQPARWLADAIAPEQVGAGADSFVVLRQLALAGLGLAILPRILGDRSAGLERIRGLVPEMTVPVWVASHYDLADVTRIVRAREELATRLRALGPELQGSA